MRRWRSHFLMRLVTKGTVERSPRCVDRAKNSWRQSSGSPRVGGLASGGDAGPAGGVGWGSRGCMYSHRSGMHRVGVDGGWRWGPGPWEMACIHPGRLRSGVYMLGGNGSGRGCGEDTHRAGTSGVRACVRGAVRVGLPLMAQAALRGCVPGDGRAQQCTRRLAPRNLLPARRHSRTYTHPF